MEVETEVKVKRLVREKEEQMAEADVELGLHSKIGQHWPVVHWHVQAGSFGWKASNVDAGS